MTEKEIYREERKIILTILFNYCHLVDKIEINQIISLKIPSICPNHIFPSIEWCRYDVTL